MNNTGRRQLIHRHSGRRRQCVADAILLHELVVDPQTEQVECAEGGKRGSDNNERALPFLLKNGFDRTIVFDFPRFLVDAPAVFVFDPSRVTPVSLVVNDLKRAIEVVSDRFDCPSRHGAPKTIRSIQAPPSVNQ